MRRGVRARLNRELRLHLDQLLLLRLEQSPLVGLEPRDLGAKRSDLLGGRGHRRLWARLEIELASKRGALERALLAAGLLQHVIPHIDHHVADARAFRIDVTQQGRGEGAVAAGAVERHLAGLGGVDDHHARRRLDARKPAADGDRTAYLGEAGGKRIVAAGIEKDDAGRRVPHHLFQHQFQLHRLEIEIGFGAELGVDWSEEIAAVDLEAVAGIVKEADIGAGENVGESADALLHVALAEIDAVDHLETEAAQLRRHVAGIVAGIGEAGGVLIGGVADDEGDALLGCRGRKRCDERC